MIANDSSLIKNILLEIEDAVTELLSTRNSDGHLHSEIEMPGRNLLLLGGKRWRPLLLVLTCRLCCGPESTAIKLTPIVELPHTGSLIIDDIEDGADLRRGEPAAHISHGLDLAINAGNLFYFLPRKCILQAQLESRIELLVYRFYLEAMEHLHYGQGLDILWHQDPDWIPDVNEYIQMCNQKSGSLSGLATGIGAALSALSEAQMRALHQFGKELGVCFQIIDDVRNLTTGNPGKIQGDDIIEGKKSLPVILYCQRDKASRRRLTALLAACSQTDTRETLVKEAIQLMNSAGVVELAREIAYKRYLETMENIELLMEWGDRAEWSDLKEITDSLIY